MNFLATRANTIAESNTETYEEYVRVFNGHAVWMAADLCLAFALRGSREYELPTSELRNGNELNINDKDVHESGLSPLPIPLHIKANFTYWISLCEEMVLAFRALGDSKSVNLADKIEEQVLDKECVHPVFTIDVLGELCGVGYLPRVPCF